jgi:NADPH:quinone reductase-like Zn-dependent oxidoreductase
VVDYTREDFTRSGQRYDLLLDVAGSRPWRECRRVLNREAALILIGGPKANPWLGPLGHLVGVRAASLRASQRVAFFIAKATRDDLDVLRELLESGKVTPVVDRQFALSELPEALQYLGTGHARAKVVITV